MRRGRLHPPLHHDAILQFRALDRGAVVVERAVREGRAYGVVAGEVLRARATREDAKMRIRDEEAEKTRAGGRGRTR
jgi:hypothetical protein